MVFRHRHFINLHKITTPFVIIFMMLHYNNFTVGSCIYFGLHTGYCICWLLKELMYPDPSFNEEMTTFEFVCAYLVLMVYWIAPYMLISSGIIPHTLTILASIPLCLVGFLFHFGADSQKYFSLEIKKGLITTGFFSRTRNPNYFGEVMIYIGWGILAESIIPLVVLLVMVLTLFFPRMLRKDKSMSRYPEFKAYQERTNLLFPRIF